ncbi:MAG: VWA domain-containing protein [Gammaproteobacteria bacterium]|nr:VWA domain-containing protein [Gammaproteobacteria bacterium]
MNPVARKNGALTTVFATLLLTACTTSSPTQNKLEAEAPAPSTSSLLMLEKSDGMQDMAAVSHLYHRELRKKELDLSIITPGEQYSTITENRRIQVSDEPVSTFSIDVDTAAYANVRRFINGGNLPPKNAVRVEEMVNYFDYDYPVPESESTPFNITTEIGPTPWNNGSYLLHIGIQGYEPTITESQPRNLVFLLDVSGSMNAANKLGLLKKSLRLLVNQLTSQDRVAIVVYAGASGVVLESTPGNRRSEIIDAMERLRAGGSTNGGAGIELAYSIAQQHFNKDGINRVILATDGDFNVGPSNTDALKALIKEKKRSGVGLTILGFGMGNYNDQLLESISNAGDGNAAYIDTLQEAQKVLVEEIGSTLSTIARDTKIQIEFNPEIVSSYRLVGYENRLLNNEDFKNDHIDAGDVGAGHSVTALYEIILTEPLRYNSAPTRALPFNGELAFLKLRYKRPDESSSIEMQHAIVMSDRYQRLAGTSNNFRFTAAVAGFGQRLRNSDSLGSYSYPEILTLAQQSRGEDLFGYRAEFIQLVSLADALQ